MAVYHVVRIYEASTARRDARVSLDAATDDAAIREAREITDAAFVEVWCGGRMIARIAPPKGM